MAKLKQSCVCELDFSTEPTEASGQFETALLGSLIPEMTPAIFIIVKGQKSSVHPEWEDT